MGVALEPSLLRSSMKHLDALIRLRIKLGIPLQLSLLVLGMVAVLLVAVGTVVSARDALENNGHLHEDVDGNSNFH